MKRQKRDRTQRVFIRGYQAGLSGRSKDACPSQQDDLRQDWINGWREGREDRWSGFKGVSAIHKNPSIL
ncbi:ribosome modulation factor [Terasakiispira papahanaumokuakeensis]|uniref:Ribosome modulation factor n=1 Tax=Terasakiispira papahanaumokuakeensis TaxID=197479 RepID=A0A1E2VEH2_9GAMM|nr:ribosome modulation factor [Terasakiispira papahanaumokuakeensis]ODC05364.1 ribosome modulation factor [Terasakiispira papahanaumokuakeensis]